MKLLIIITTLILSQIGNAANIPDGLYSIDLDHANIGFSVTHMGISNTIGRFNKFEGSVNFESNGNSKVKFSISADSVDTNNPTRDAHIRKVDFLETATFPKINFESDSVSYDQDGNPIAIKGKLNLHGITKNVTFNVIPVGFGTFDGKTRAGFVATTNLIRADFGITGFVGVVGDAIKITVSLEIIK